jgi:hypothetical protein
MGRSMSFRSRGERFSEATGTPGVNLGNANAFAAVAENTALIVAKIDANQAITDRVDGLTEAQNATILAGQSVTRLQSIANTDDSIDTNVSMAEQTESLDNFNKKSLENIPDRKVRQIAKLKLVQNRTTALNNIAKWGLNRQSVKSFTAGTEAVNLLTQQAEEVPTYNELLKTGGLLETSKQWGQSVGPMLSDDNRVKFIRAAETLPIRGYINGQMKVNPLHALLEFNGEKVQADGKTIKSHFNPEEQKSIRSDIEKAIKGLDPTVNRAHIFHLNADRDADRELLLQNDPRAYRKAKERAEKNGTLTDEARRFYDSGFKNSLTDEWRERPKNLVITSKLIAGMKEIVKSLDEGVTPMLSTLYKWKSAVTQEQGLTIGSREAAIFLGAIRMPTRKMVSEFTNAPDPFFAQTRRLRNFSPEENRVEWNFPLPGIDKNLKFNINEVNVSPPDSFLEVSDIAGTVNSYLSGKDWRNKVTATVSGAESVERHVAALNLPLHAPGDTDVKIKNKSGKLLNYREEVQAEMVSLYLEQIALWNNEHLDQDITQNDVNYILENIIPQTAYLKRFPSIPPDGLDFIFRGEKITILPGGEQRRR